MNQQDDPIGLTLKSLFERRFQLLMSPLEIFIHRQTTASILLILFITVALGVSNSEWGHILERLKNIELGLHAGRYNFTLSLNEWVSEGLMSLFFFLVGLEIKREILAGKLNDKKEIVLISVAALGGIFVPAVLYYLANQDGPGRHGWGIPTATDTAFSVGVLAILASRVSVGLTVFLTALAIFDDIGAMAIISIFYAEDIDTLSLLIGILVLAILFLGNSAGVRKGWFYCILGFLLWICVYKSGIHPTFAGILLALTIPARPVISQSMFIKNLTGLIKKFDQKNQIEPSILGSSLNHSIVSDIGSNVKAASTPLQRWETPMIMPIAIIVVPLFSLLNSGFLFTEDLLQKAASSSVTLGVILGLVLGKPVGVMSGTYLCLKLGIGKLPDSVSLKEVAGAAFLTGIGFTMSIFFTTLSFPEHDDLAQLAKLGILISSFVSALLGLAWIYAISEKRH